LLDPLLDLGQRLRELLFPRRVRRQLELTLHFRSRQLQRLDLADTLRVRAFAALARLPLFFFAFFHPLGEAGFRVDESFSGVTHVQSWLLVPVL
jgi:hypothetical protein